MKLSYICKTVNEKKTGLSGQIQFTCNISDGAYPEVGGSIRGGFGQCELFLSRYAHLLKFVPMSVTASETARLKFVLVHTDTNFNV